MADPGIVGSLDFPPPIGQTFGNIHVWTDLYPFVKVLVDETENVAHGWWDLAAAIDARLKDLIQVKKDFKAIIDTLDEALVGTAGTALQDKGNQLAGHMQSLIDAISESALPIGNTGHDIKVYARAFWEAHIQFHKLTQIEETRFVKAVNDVYQAAISQDAPTDVQDRARRAAYQMVEQNLMIPHQRKLLKILADKYTGKDPSLDPIIIKPQNFNTVSGVGGLTHVQGAGAGGNGSGPGAGSGSGTGGGSGPGAGSGSGNSPERQAALDDAKKAADNAIDGLKKPGDSPERTQALNDAKKAVDDALGGLAGGGSGPGAGSGDGSGAGSGAGTGSGGGSGAGDKNKALQDAKDAADKAIDDLAAGGGSPGGGSSGGGSPGGGSPGGGGSGRPPTTSSNPDADRERQKALQDAKDAADKAIDDMLGAGQPGTSSSGPDAGSDRANALESAKKAADGAIQDLIDKNKAAGGDPAQQAARDKALHDAKDAADKAIDGLLGAGADGPSDPETRDDALDDAKKAADKAIDDLARDGDSAARDKALDDAKAAADKAIKDLIGPGDASTHDGAIEDAKEAADKAIDKLIDATDPKDTERLDALHDAEDAINDSLDGLAKHSGSGGSGGSGGSDTASDAIRDDALADAKGAVDDEIDQLIEDTKADSHLSAADKATRIDALNDARGASDGVINDLIKQDGVHLPAAQSALSSFLTGGEHGGGVNGGGGGNGGGNGNGNSNGVQLGVSGGLGDGSSQGPPMVLDGTTLNSAGQGNQGMPMAPPMGGMGAGGNQPRERDRNTWLDGEAGMWDDEDDETVSWRAIGRNPT